MPSLRRSMRLRSDGDGGYNAKEPRANGFKGGNRINPDYQKFKGILVINGGKGIPFARTLEDLGTKWRKTWRGYFSLAKSKQGWSILWESFSKTLKNFIEAFCNDGMPYELFEFPGSFATIASHQYGVRARKVINANRIIDGLIGYANCKGGNKQSRVNNPEIPVFGTYSEFSDERTMDGPIYFLNHACQPNCQVEKFGKKGYRVKSLRTIKPGEELTITYGRGYFEARKEPCWCSSCTLTLK